jgi:hypothetical protein
MILLFFLRTIDRPGSGPVILIRGIFKFGGIVAEIPPEVFENLGGIVAVIPP